MGRRRFLSSVLVGGLFLAGLRLGEYDRLLDPLLGWPRLPDRRPQRARFFTTIVPSRLIDYHRKATGRRPRPEAVLGRLLDLPFKGYRFGVPIAAAEEPDGFRQPDAVVNAALSRGKEIYLSVGLKVPGYPEFYPPRAMDLPRFGPFRPGPAEEERIFRAVEAILGRYGRVGSWVFVENEALDPVMYDGLFRYLHPDYLVSICGHVRRLLGPDQLLVLTTFVPSAWFLRLLDQLRETVPWRFLARWAVGPWWMFPSRRTLYDEADLLGLHLYKKVVQPTIWGEFPVYAEHPRDYNTIDLLRVEMQRRGKGVIVSELQGSPWEPDVWAKFHADYKFSFAPDDIADLVQVVLSRGITQVGMWDVDFWLAAEAAGDPSWLKTGVDVVERYSEPRPAAEAPTPQPPMGATSI